MGDNGADHEAGSAELLSGSWKNGARTADIYSRGGEAGQEAMKDDDRWEALNCTLTGICGDIKSLHDRMDVFNGRMDKFGAELETNTAMTATNTAMTKQLQNIKTTWRLGTVALLWLGTVAGALTAIYVLAYQWLHGGKLPPQ